MRHFWAIWIPLCIILFGYGFIEIEYTNKNYRLVLAYILVVVGAIGLGIEIWGF